MKITGADIVVECLLEQGVDTVFGYPGGTVLFIYDSLYNYSEKIRHILTAHEQGAAHAADGYARSSGKTGVVIATSGPGATNLVTGLATAYMDSVPMVAITGNVAMNLLGLDSFQEVDITSVTMPVTKHNFIVKDVKELADILRKAFYIANSGRKGPVLVDIPKDITAQLCDFENNPVRPIPVEDRTTEQDIQLALDMIGKSRKPFVYTGGGVISSGAAKEVAVFAEKVDAPVSSSLMGQGSFDNTNERYIGMLGMHGTVTSAKAIGDCDLFIGIGTRFSDRVIGNITDFAPKAKILQIEIDPAEINKNIKVHHNLIGDVKAVVTKLNQQLQQQSHKSWMKQIISWKKEYPLIQVGKDEEAITPQYVLEILDKLTNSDTILTTEVGQHQMWTAQYYPFVKPRTFITSGGLGTMGYGLGASLGTKVANPDKVVVNIAGDGSFHMNCNELVTASKHNIPIIELIMNNQVLGMVRQWQRLFYGKRFSHTTLERPTDYVMLANAFGLDAFRMTKKSEVEETLKKALALQKPVVIDCVIDRDINVIPMVPAGKSILEPILQIEIDD